MPVPTRPAFERIEVTLSERQRAALRAETGRYRPIPSVLAGFLAVNSVLLVAYLLWHATHAGSRLTVVPLVFAATVYIIVLLVFALTRFGSQPALDGTYELTEPGLRIVSGARAGTIPWPLIARVIDTGSAFIVERYLLAPAIVIPKSALPDGGPALWAEFDRHLTGPRLLVRSTARANAIVNTLPPASRTTEHRH